MLEISGLGSRGTVLSAQLTGSDLRLLFAKSRFSHDVALIAPNDGTLIQIIFEQVKLNEGCTAKKKGLYLKFWIWKLEILYEPCCEKTGFLHM